MAGRNTHILLNDFIDRVYHVHMNDISVMMDGRSGLLGAHIDFGDHRKAWNFRSLEHGNANFEEIIRVLNRYNYSESPLG